MYILHFPTFGQKSSCSNVGTTTSWCIACTLSYIIFQCFPTFSHIFQHLPSSLKLFPTHQMREVFPVLPPFSRILLVIYLKAGLETVYPGIHSNRINRPNRSTAVSIWSHRTLLDLSVLHNKTALYQDDGDRLDRPGHDLWTFHWCFHVIT